MERSRKLVFVAHPILNQNSMPIGKEKAAGAVKEVVEILAENGVGIIQLPCPEQEYLGIDRKPKNKEALDNKIFRALCKKYALQTLSQIEAYMKKNYQILAILGVEFSPTYGVHQIENGTRNTPGKGIFIEELEEEMRKKRFQIPIVGVNLNNALSSAEKLQGLVNA